MLALAGLLTVLAVLAAILSRRLSAFVALSLIPVIAALLLGEGVQLGEMMLAGFGVVAPTAAMFLFAILFFSIMAEAGLFRPIVASILRFSGHSPARIAVGTAVLASIVHLDGSGASTFLITIPALLPVYDDIGMDRRVLACVTAMAAGVGNMLPWGGPTLRAAAALEMDVVSLFMPVLPIYALGLACVFGFAWWIGSRQEAKIEAGAMQKAETRQISSSALLEEAEIGSRMRYAVNLLTVIAVIALMLGAILPPAIAFFLGTAVAVIVNLRGIERQRAAIERHAPAAVLMVAVLFAAGSFTGILRGTGMLDAMAQTGSTLLPDGAAGFLPALIGVLGVPLSLLFDPDSFYFGILPVLGAVAEAGGMPAADVARGAILGQMTTGFAISPLTPATFLLVGLARVDLADHQRFTFPFLFAIGIIMTIAGVLTGVLAP